MQLKIVLDYH